MEIIRERGLDLTSHESQPLTDRLVNYADQILTMTRGHREAIVTYWPTAANRTAMLSMSNEDVSSVLVMRGAGDVPAGYAQGDCPGWQRV